VLAARRINKLDAAAASLKAINPSVEVLIVKTDVAAEADVASLFEKVQSAFGRPADVVISNAGSLSEAVPIGKTDPVYWWKSLVRLFPAFFQCDCQFYGQPLNSSLRLARKLGRHKYLIQV